MHKRRTLWPGIAAAVCLLSAGSPSVHAQTARPDVVALLEAYATTGRADFRFQSRNEAVASIQAWPATVDRWIRGGAQDDGIRRAHVAALAALELSLVAFDALDIRAPAGLQRELLEAAHSHLVRLPPNEFERRWLKASTGLLVAGGLVEARAHLATAVERFPKDSRLQLNQVLMDRDSTTLVREPGTPQPRLAESLGHGDRTRTRPRPGTQLVGRAEPVFSALLHDSEVGLEAAARLGWLRFHQNKLTESRTLFGRAMSEADDPFVINLAALGLGLTHLASGNSDDATTAFRAAMAALPAARTATTALAMQLYLAGQRREASELLDQLAGVPNTLDPWKHVHGADRFAQDIIRELRAGLGVPPQQVTVSPRQARPADRPLPVPVAAAETSAELPRPGAARPIFSAMTSVVSVDADVLNGRRPVEGLRAADFEVRDNGVLQTIEDFSLEGLPLDVSVVLDLRDIYYATSEGRQWTAVDDATSQGVADTARLSALLGPNDRLRIVTATRDVSEPHPLQGPGGRAAHRVAREVMPAAALYDAIFTALARMTAPNRRHLVLVFTDGLDGSSIVSPSQLLESARTSDALVRVFRRDTADEFFRRSRPARGDTMSDFLLWPHDPSVLPAVAEATSGSLERINSTGQSVVADVKRTLESFRQRYVLRYRPTGVEPNGWHQISVRVTRPGRYTVDARRGYHGG